MLVIISSIIETGTFFGVLLPSDWILSIAVIVFVGLENKRNTIVNVAMKTNRDNKDIRSIFFFIAIYLKNGR